MQHKLERMSGTYAGGQYLYHHYTLSLRGPDDYKTAKWQYEGEIIAPSPEAARAKLLAQETDLYMWED